MMREYLSIYGKAVVLVGLTALNVRLVSRGMTVPAFVTGGLLSYVWWYAAHSAANSKLRYAPIVYAFGAACGTEIGMWIGGLSL